MKFTSSAHLVGGGTISGDLTIDGDLTVNGDNAGAFDEIINGQLKILRSDASVSGENTNRSLHLKQEGSGDVNLVFSDNTISFNMGIDNSANAFKISTHDNQLHTNTKFTLDTSGNATIAGRVAISSAFTAGELLGVKGVSDTDYGARIENTHANGLGALVKVASSGTGQALEVRSGATTLFKVLANGTSTFASNVGIGVTDVPSDFMIARSENTAFNGAETKGQDDVGSTITVANNSTGANTFAQLNFQVSASSGRGVARIVGIREDSQASALAFVTENSDTASEKMRINGAGSVGIGTPSPTDSGLHINGSGSRGRLKIQQTSASDYSLVSCVTPSRQWNVGVGGASGASALRNNFFIQDVTGSVTPLILDANSRISLSNNDSGGTTGSDSTSANTLIGYKAGQAIESGGVRNTLLGHASGFKITTGDDNTSLGQLAGFGNLTGINNTFIGSNSGLSDNTTSHSNNTAVGFETLKLITDGASNTVMGSLAGDSITTESNNTLIGKSAGSTISHSSANGTTSIGAESLISLTTGTGVTATGFQSGRFNTTGASSTFIGYQAGQGVIGAVLTGNANTAIGRASGFLLQGTAGGNTLLGSLSGDAITTGTNNTILGQGADVSDAAGSNRIGLGQGVIVGVNNIAVIGNNDVTDVYMAQNSGAKVHAGRVAISSSITDGIGLNIEADSLTTGNVARFYSDSDSTAIRNLVEITNDNVDAVGTTSLKVRNDSSNSAQVIEIQGAEGTVSGTPDGDGHEFVIRNNADAGMSILAGQSSGHTSAIVFGSAGDLNGANMLYEYHIKTMKIGTQHSSGILKLRSGNGVDALTIDASQNATLAGDLAFTTDKNISWGSNAQNKIFGSQNGNYLKFYANNGAKLVLDANSRISLSNNDLGGTDGRDSLSGNTILGYKAGNAISDADVNNVLIGHNAGLVINAGEANSIIGTAAGEALTSGDLNVALGYFALSTSTNVDKVVAIGAGAMEDGDVTDAADGTIAIGSEALYALTSGASNTAVGFQSLKANQQGDSNTAIGYEALLANIDGGDNTAVGYQALKSLNINSSDTSASFNTAVGTRALDGMQTGTHNTAIGADAMGSADGAETENTAIGYRAMFRNNNGVNNTCIGAGATLSADAGAGQIAIGKDVVCIANETATIGLASNVASLGLDGSDTSWAASSDERLKENIADATAGLDVINDLRPVTYNWKKAKDINKSMPQYKDSDEPVLGKEYGESLHGFIAQEVKVVIDKHDSLKEGFKMWKQTDNGTQTLADGNLIPILVKAVQELTARVKELESK